MEYIKLTYKKLQTVIIALGLIVGGCGEHPNNPYPEITGDSNTLFSAFTQRPKHLDPAVSYSSDEAIFTYQIYEPPLQYAYLTRPFTLEPLTAENMPEVRKETKDGEAYTIYTITIKPGIYYQPHPAFATDTETGDFLYHDLPFNANYKTLQAFPKTGTRELVAEDYVFEIKRLADPRVNSPIYGLMAEKIVGLRELAQALRSSDKEVDLKVMPLSGVRALSRYQYEIKVRGEYPQFIYWLSMPFFCPMPWEAIAFYNQPALERNNVILDWYPVGTGPFYLTENNPNLRMVLTKNPNFHGETYPDNGTKEDRAAGLLINAGKPLPLLDRVIFTREKESIPYWAKFLQGYYDAAGVSADNFDQALNVSGTGNIALSQEMKEKGIHLSESVSPSMYYWGFNMLDKKIGQLNDKQRKLRQAISIAMNANQYINIFLNGRGLALQGPLPPGIFGFHDETSHVNPYVYRVNRFQRIERRSLSDAKKLLSEAGYPKGIDPKTQKPLILYLDIPASGNPDGQAQVNWYREQLKKIGIDLVIRATQYNRFQDKIKNGDFQLFYWGWNADYPDPENFLFLFTTRQGRVHHGGENASNYSNPEYDALFEQMKLLPNSPERDAIIQKMVKILQKDNPWIWGFTPTDFVLRQKWVNPYKPNPMVRSPYKYQSIRPEVREKARLEWNQPIRWPILIGVLIILVLSIPSVIFTWQKMHQKYKRVPDKRK